MFRCQLFSYHLQLSAITVQGNLSCFSVISVFVLPFPSLKLPLKINLVSLCQIFFSDIDEVFIENDDAVPFRSFLLLPVFSFPSPAESSAGI